MPWTSKRRASAGALSTSTLTSLSCPAMPFAELFESRADSARHGPHQSAHRSTRTGSVEATAISSKSSSPASVIQGSTDPHLPHLGVPEAFAGTRFFVPHFSQLTIFARVVAIRFLSDCVGWVLAARIRPVGRSARFGSMASLPPRPITLLAPAEPRRPRAFTTSLVGERIQGAGRV